MNHVMYCNKGQSIFQGTLEPTTTEIEFSKHIMSFKTSLSYARLADFPILLKVYGQITVSTHSKYHHKPAPGPPAASEMANRKSAMLSLFLKVDACTSVSQPSWAGTPILQLFVPAHSISISMCRDQHLWRKKQLSPFWLSNTLVFGKDHFNQISSNFDMALKKVGEPWEVKYRMRAYNPDTFTVLFSTLPSLSSSDDCIAGACSLWAYRGALMSNGRR